MSSKVTLPELGENVEGGVVVELFVAKGDHVDEGQPLLEVEAGKGTVDVPAPASGKIVAVLVGEGDEIETGHELFELEKSDSSSNGQEEETQEPRESTASVNEKKSESKKSKADSQPSKPARESTSARPREPDQPKPDRQTSTEVTPAATVTRPAPAGDDTAKKLVPASPATRLLARELGVDLAQVNGTARNGRVTQEDVKAHVRRLASSTATGGAPGMRLPPLPDFGKWGETEVQSLNVVRQKTAEHMALSWSQIPHVTQHDLADVTDLEAFRKSQGSGEVKITVTAFAAKASAIALREFPQFNASLDLANNQLVLKRYYHLGIAVDTERGLLVPVLRDVDKKSIYQLAGELSELAERARNKKTSSDDLSGGTFTITNLGGIGGTAFTPIINYPETAILGMSRARWQPVIQNGQSVPRLLLPLSLSYDHRVIDGADAARFTRRIAEMLEKPLVMLLHA